MQIKEKHLLLECLLIFSGCFVVYLANGRTIESGDTIPNSLLALNWLQNNTLHFDAFRQSYLFDIYHGSPYFFAESAKGHLTSVYPVGTAIVTLPIYFLLSLYLNLLAFIKTNISGVVFSFDITSPAFESYRLILEKLTATIITSLSVVILYISIRLKFSLTVALITSFIYAFATNTWITNSQALWQHTATGLVLTSLILCLLKANRAGSSYLRLLLSLTGILCGLLLIIRPTNLFFSIAVVVYVIATHRRMAVFLLLGLLICFLGLAWNLYNFDDPLGGYVSLGSAYKVTFYKFSVTQFIQGFLGLLFSPSRGILVFSPIMLLGIPGLWQAAKKYKVSQDERLILSLAMAAVALFLSYCFYTIWWSGGSYGPRFLSDISPVVCYLIAYFIDANLDSSFKNQKAFILNTALCLFLLVTSTTSQVVGVFGKANWSGQPVDVDTHPLRLWDLKDTQLSRHANSLFFQVVKPIENPVKYAQALAGSIEKVEVVDTWRLDNPGPIPSVVAPEQLIILSAKVRNTGKSKWFGYEGGVMPGETRIRLKLLNRSNIQVLETRLLIKGFAKQTELTEAIGPLQFPVNPGPYKLVFDLISEGIGEFPSNAKNGPYEATVLVQPQLSENL